MAIFIKRFLYVINILIAVYVVFAILFSINSITANYKKLSEVNYSIEKEYNEILEKYKKTMVFVLKNNLPENISYFDLISSATYNLPPVKELKLSKSKDVVVRDNGSKASNNGDTNSTMECYNGKCIKVHIGKKEILGKVSKSKLWGYGEIETIPIKKATLLKISANLFLEAHKNLIIITLSCFFVLYLLQSLFLFIRNYRLTKTNFSLLKTSDKNNQELTKQSAEYNKLCDSVLFIQELAGEYFTHYVHQLIIRDVCIEEVDLIDVLQRIEKFFNHQTTKRNLKIIVDCEDAVKTIKSDSEIMFIVLLNLLFKAIYRAKISSKIFIKIFQEQRAIKIEINDTGYEYSPKLNGKIQMCELPNPVLKNLYQKLEIEVEEIRKDEVSTISIKTILDFEINKLKGNIIKFDFINGH
jgi:hypothetical protein